MKRLLIITALAAMAIGIFLGTCAVLAGNNVAITADGMRVINPDGPQPEPPFLTANGTGSMLGKDITMHDADHVRRILSTAPVAAADVVEMVAANPGIFVPHYQEGWRNDITGVTYKMGIHTLPVTLGENDMCRNFTLEGALGSATDHLSGLACPEPEGWSFHNATGAN